MQSEPADRQATVSSSADEAARRRLLGLGAAGALVLVRSGVRIAPPGPRARPASIRSQLRAYEDEGDDHDCRAETRVATSE